MQPQQQGQQGYGGGNAYGQYAPTVADASVEDRAQFIVKTYLHLTGAIFAFVALLTVFFVTGVSDTLTNLMLGEGWQTEGTSQLRWLMVLGLFMVVATVANKYAHSNISKSMQYMGLGLYVLMEAIIFVPLIAIVFYIGTDLGGGSGMDVLGEAGLITVGIFGGLTAVVFITRKNFSFLRSVLLFGGIAVIALIIMSAVIGFQLGAIFMWGMVVFASISILYNTSNVLHEYDTNQYVAAALSLFASFALLLWYVIQIVASRD